MSAGALGRALSRLLEDSHTATFDQLPALLGAAARRAGAGGARLFVADLQEDVLREVTGVGLDAGHGGQEARIEGTLPGRAYRMLRITTTPTGSTCWSPVLDGAERLGVLRVDPAPGTTTVPDQDVVRALASMAGLLLVSKRNNSDAHARLTRTREMSVPAEMQWTLMPPRTFANDRLTVSAVMEPAYQVAGDAFDYAIADDHAHLAVFDAMGHDTAAGLTASLAMATCRSHRRSGSPLAAVSHAIEETLMEQFGHSRYVTGILADLDLATGQLSWVNRGHLLPVVIRGGRWVTTLHCSPAGPMGTGLGLPAHGCTDQLEPGDRLLLFTDGITEARGAHGELFGVERFTDFLIRHHADGLPVAETLRRLIHAVLDHHDSRLEDDATVLFCEWHGKPPTAH
ncbi:putative serine phosphatase [Streptomyces ambofaciens ATCC 23877]|uniref:Putative serine phosphatase n=1 Tax=Streptomyces ambofaciens (strain ATCC 23877 / 3486 / DSM 40053 / JCM 4204 / NBRC 12836 / NRRL B-2516) TaxID=278992 RepID=Q1RR12_STRA7|nr:PP2C family protein-serine/threonine phosphatase [Streptomyces ambofaciens]AKZ53149.1 putative serine phosphatase [Streptomyces ambofaciens ATCC 23877]AKZ60614.1 putative serine phosphatase [Streptomyces ambofaciens ATCC 23877]CAI78003.1 putative serine phosphatase [Streptomyces ambofaciens ATCC 23877]CAI78277.1 putative serine phosphatase [Streptomyces ambofaciens ATCC 23877]CAJ87783.1 putative serine phosphatase [Streptomyces ambofaciens ATCC 23877]